MGSVCAGISAGGRISAVVEVNSETDFVARNNEVPGFGGGVVGVILSYARAVGDLDTLPFPNTRSNVGRS